MKIILLLAVAIFAINAVAAMPAKDVLRELLRELEKDSSEGECPKIEGDITTAQLREMAKQVHGMFAGARNKYEDKKNKGDREGQLMEVETFVEKMEHVVKCGKKIVGDKSKSGSNEVAGTPGKQPCNQVISWWDGIMEKHGDAKPGAFDACVIKKELEDAFFHNFEQDFVCFQTGIDQFIADEENKDVAKAKDDIRLAGGNLIAMHKRLVIIHQAHVYLSDECNKQSSGKRELGNVLRNILKQ